MLRQSLWCHGLLGETLPALGLNSCHTSTPFGVCRSRNQAVLSLSDFGGRSRVNTSPRRDLFPGRLLLRPPIRLGWAAKEKPVPRWCWVGVRAYSFPSRDLLFQYVSTAAPLAVLQKYKKSLNIRIKCKEISNSFTNSRADRPRYPRRGSHCPSPAANTRPARQPRPSQTASIAASQVLQRVPPS